MPVHTGATCQPDKSRSIQYNGTVVIGVPVLLGGDFGVVCIDLYTEVVLQVVLYGSDERRATLKLPQCEPALSVASPGQ